jgi:hypothetical protein
VAELTWPRPAASGRRQGRLRARAATTPGRLRLALAAILLAVLVAGLVLAGATTVRHEAVVAVATREEPLMVEADGLYAALSDADATAATTFLRGGIEPPALRARYLADLRRAGVQLSGLAQRVQGSPEAAAAVAAVSAQLPVYSGLIDTARANNRQGFPVGAAYLREGSDLMRNRILPAARRLYAVEARRLGDHQRTGTATGGLVAVLLVCVGALAVLVAVQVFVARRTHRVFNVPLVAATVLLAGLTAWVTIAMTSSRSSLARAQREGSDPVQVLSAARILALRAQADESLALVARGGADGDRDRSDFDTVAYVLAPPGGLLVDARSGSSADVRRLVTRWRSLQAEHARVGRLESGGRFGEAARLAVGPGAREAALAHDLDRDLSRLIGAAQQRFERAAGDARSALGGLAVGIPLVLVACAALALLGLQQRVNEFR